MDVRLAFDKIFMAKIKKVVDIWNLHPKLA